MKSQTLTLSSFSNPNSHSPPLSLLSPGDRHLSPYPLPDASLPPSLPHTTRMDLMRGGASSPLQRGGDARRRDKTWQRVDPAVSPLQRGGGVRCRGQGVVCHVDPAAPSLLCNVAVAPPLPCSSSDARRRGVDLVARRVDLSSSIGGGASSPLT